MKDRLMLLLISNRLPRLVLALFSLGVIVLVLNSRIAPALLAPDTDQFTNIAWTTTTVTFDYQAAEDCPSLTFHLSYRDASNNELASDRSLDGSSHSAGVRYGETFTLAPGTTVPDGTTQIVITTSCSHASPTPS
jgi:hypothetical protein